MLIHGFNLVKKSAKNKKSEHKVVAIIRQSQSSSSLKRLIENRLVLNELEDFYYLVILFMCLVIR
jgi:hypothetical protein